MAENRMDSSELPKFREVDYFAIITSRHIELLPRLHLFQDTCNVYVLCDGDESLVIDFGSGAWLEAARALGLPAIRRVYLTHHHADQCSGLLTGGLKNLEVHAPAGEEPFLSRDGVAALQNDLGGMMWFPQSYGLLDQGFPPGTLQYDMEDFDDHYWQKRRIRFVPTPGHSPAAISLILDHEGKELAFCGDAFHSGATIHQPYCLEWDHWTATGALAAWQGVRRLASLGLDMLLPSHGSVVAHQPRKQLTLLASKLQKFVDVKGSICAGEKDRYVTPCRFFASGAKEIVPGLYWFHNGGYLLVSATGEALITDPAGDLSELEALLSELPPLKITAQTVTHIHGDHMNAVERVRQRYGTPLWLHPWVAEPLTRGSRGDIPYLTRTPLHADALWPEEGEWRWNEFLFHIAPMPGQTWWHCGFMTTISGQKVLFGGDTFQPASRWNGTGGFCSINGSRFQVGFAASAKKILEWRPDIMVNGHGTWMHVSPSYFRKALRWAEKAEKATAALCPDGDLEKHYYLHSFPAREGNRSFA